MEDKALWTKSDVAERLGVTVRTINNWIAQNRIAYIKIGRNVRFRPSDVEDYIQRNTIEAETETEGT